MTQKVAKDQVVKGNSNVERVEKKKLTLRVCEEGVRTVGDQGILLLAIIHDMAEGSTSPAEGNVQVAACRCMLKGLEIRCKYSKQGADLLLVTDKSVE